jgi:hypothetical protein
MPRVQVQNEQHVISNEATPGEHFHGEKTDTCLNSHMRSNELRPGRLLTTFRRRRDAEAAQDVANRLIRNAMTKILQCSSDAVVSPAAILAGQPDDQFGHVAPDSRTSWISAVSGTIEFARDQLSIPGQDRFRLGYRGNLLQRTTSESSADFRLSQSLRVRRPGSCTRRILFSATRYSCCSRICWFTIPVTNANRRAICVFFIETHHHTVLTSQGSHLNVCASPSSAPSLSSFPRASRARALWDRALFSGTTSSRMTEPFQIDSKEGEYSPADRAIRIALES